MKTFDLLLSSINDVKDFVNIVSKYDFDVDLTSGRYVVDAKSIMGIFSLDLSKPIKKKGVFLLKTNFKRNVFDAFLFFVYSCSFNCDGVSRVM